MFETVTRQVLLVTALTVVTAPLTRAQDRPLDPAARIDGFVRSVMEVAPIPGLGVAVVEDDRTVLVKGYGRRDLEADLPVTENTAFYIASSTKSFTGLATALLGDRGWLDLDAPIDRYLPELELPEPRTADRVTLRQLLSHRAGLDHDGIVHRTAFSGEHDPDLVLRLLARAETGDTVFDYTNLGYVITSLILSRVAERPWQDVLAREVFRPMGLTRTTAYISEARSQGWELAAPYTTDRDGFEERRMKSDATMHAAGGVVMSAADAARWLEVQLNDGRLAGDQVLPARVIAETQRAQARLEREFFRFQRVGYGLGWYRGLYEGDTLLHHFGSYVGFRSHISFMPNHDVGVAVFINNGARDAFFAPDIIATYVYDLYLDKSGLEEKYAAALEQLTDRKARFRKMLAEDRERRADRPDRPSHPLELYVGDYHNPDYGTVRIRAENGRLVARLGEIRSVLEVYEGEDLRVELVPGRGRVMRFEITPGEPARGFVIDGDRFERALRDGGL